MQAYMKSAMPFYGVQKPARAKLARAVFDAYPLEGFDAWRDTVLALWRDARYREERYMALALLAGPPLPRVPHDRTRCRSTRS